MTENQLPVLIPLRDGGGIPSALATREHLAVFVAAAEQVAAECAQRVQDHQARIAGYRRARAYWKPGTDTTRTFPQVTARAADGRVFQPTRVDLDRWTRSEQKAIAHQMGRLRWTNAMIGAARRALALWHAGDPLATTLAMVAGRGAVPPAPVVNVAAPQVDVHVPARGPQRIEAHKGADGSLVAEVRELRA